MIDKTYFWSIIFSLTIGTFAIRSTMIYFSEKFIFSDRTKEIFSFIPAAILPALLTPLVFFHQGSTSFLLGKERFVILIFASILAYKTRNMLITICFGLISLYLVHLI